MARCIDHLSMGGADVSGKLLGCCTMCCRVLHMLRHHVLSRGDIGSDVTGSERLFQTEHLHFALHIGFDV